MFDFLLTADGWVSLLTLVVMEIILGIDNIIFISLSPTGCQRTSSSGEGS
jgi:predicted tellurium resistance membrane protein TerC